MNARSIHGALRVFGARNARPISSGGVAIRRNGEEAIAKAPKSGVILSNIGAKEAKGSVGNVERL